jgi:hypothetical protein
MFEPAEGRSPNPLTTAELDRLTSAFAGVEFLTKSDIQRLFPEYAPNPVVHEANRLFSYLGRGVRIRGDNKLGGYQIELLV